MSEQHEEKSAAATIKQIGKGASYVVMLARVRMGEALDACDEGDFETAMARLNEARMKLHPLVEAQQYLAAFTDEIRVVRGKDLVNYVGFSLYGAANKIAAIEPHEHGDHTCFEVKFEDEQSSRYRDEQEVLVVVPSE